MLEKKTAKTLVKPNRKKQKSSKLKRTICKYRQLICEKRKVLNYLKTNPVNSYPLINLDISFETVSNFEIEVNPDLTLLDLKGKTLKRISDEVSNW